MTVKPVRWTSIPNCARNFSLALGVAVLAAVVPTKAKAICLAPTVSPSSGTALIGNNPADIHARFSSVIENNFQTGNANQVVRNLSSLELADLAYLYGRANSGNTEPLLRILARTLDADALTKVESAFGQSETETAVKKFAPAQIAAQFLAHTPAARVSSSFVDRVSTIGPVTAGASPTVDMTPTEIYLDYRTAPLGSLSVTGALFETGVFIATKVSQAFGIGYAVGTVVSGVISTYDPSLEDAIGGTVDGMLQNISSAGTEFSQGNFEQGLDSLFGAPIAYSSSGDFSVSASMAFYTSESDVHCN
jgi:hypothetical protein